MTRENRAESGLGSERTFVTCLDEEFIQRKINHKIKDKSPSLPWTFTHLPFCNCILCIYKFFADLANAFFLLHEKFYSEIKQLIKNLPAFHSHLNGLNTNPV